ncbi:hypothetical protein H2200_011515 [Cladophialophora chaetospira]|uniref:Uncharacterized protein n=1 Tax=Cladophialophora chaetospira TaxID=386627 RepID=A0AA38WZH8_9EURO|nr:hypothetical protein H2200_011515 [Cladophialophora chaetospira]
MATDFDFFDHLAQTDDMKIKYLFFDCDNTLVLSEDVASEVCCDLINDILKIKGCAVRFSSEKLISDFVGLNFRRIMAILQQQYGFQLSQTELKTYIRIQEERVITNIRAKTKPCPGVRAVLARLSRLGVDMAVVSSSSLCRIRACLETTGLLEFFDDNKIFSAADSLPVPSSKPDPAIYLHALEKLGAPASACLTVEDSMSGARAALGANLKCLGYVGSTHTYGKRIEMATYLRNAGCVEIMWHWGNYGRHLSTVEAQEKDEAERLRLLQSTEGATKRA